MGNNESSALFPRQLISSNEVCRAEWQASTRQDANLQHRPVASRQYYILPHGTVERRSSALAVNLESPRFHPHAKGKNIRLDTQLRRATRKNSFCHGLTFSQRPIRLYEQVRLRLSGVHSGWSGALRFGFTNLDPGELASSDIPKYACPDLVARPGYWAKALPERLAARDNMLAFWVDRHGRVFYTVNDGEPVLFHCGLSASRPLWAIIDIYGITQEVILLESTFADSTSCLSVTRLSAYLPPSNHDSANYSNNQLESNQAAKMAALHLSSSTQLSPCCSSSSSSSPFGLQRLSRGLPSSLDADLRFHPVRGADVVLSSDRAMACVHSPDGIQTLVFSDRPMRLGETLFMEVSHMGPPCLGMLLFGVTSCDPGTLHATELPAEPDALLDRKEYWVVHRGLPAPAPGDVLSFMLLPDGEVHHGINGVARGRLLCVDSSQALWTFFALRGAINRLRILGTLQASPSTSPSVSHGTASDDSDSDLTFGVNRSSSASESSLVTAPSSPLSPPISPSLSFPETPLNSKGSECTVCFDQEVDTVIYTCGHMCLCHECGLKLKKQINACCPICRRPIKDVIKTYRP
ncbi:E3 ubiquitin-protein ligase NEURL1B isoform X2 [Neoarius graeffei]|uniref:E3 ubiquitin-protein ligase NEURL1B isoform X2 n=1 Tax=Neoarius graeffei TaxID=443677 RepID=UPI00298BCD2E|nr:E3 ubiquitin-protein ligase NEURL1B isoform X2 [Neoarius graeffei]